MENYKEKYECALETIQEILSSGSDSIMMSRLKLRLQSVFPELKESEDEKVRKEIIDYCHERLNTTYGALPNIETIKRWLTWLEKQGEQKVSVADFKAKDWYVSKVDGKIRNIYHSVDKVEPKFKVGDWITDGDRNLFQIAKIDNEWYYADDGDRVCFDVAHDYYHLWTIQDAKDGDVLDFDCGIGIFKNLSTSGYNAHCYCYYDRSGKLETNDCCLYDIYEAKPATKEQRDLLFSKMKEAGYEWDNKKKELKQLTQSVTKINEEDEKIITALKEGFRYHQLFNPTFGGISNVEIIAWLKSLKKRLGGK